MLKLELKSLRWQVLPGVLLAATLAMLIPAAPVAAQPGALVRGLPDFTELVEQVGPSVVNIRTTEKVRSNGGPGCATDEEMQEFFLRVFGVPMPHRPPPSRRQNRPQCDERPPAGW